MEVDDKKRKKGSISEEDVSLLLQRYSATTILALLQEVSQFPGVKVDWNTLVKKTSTGITSARECQMIWRHLAYRETLLVKPEDSTEPLDDDSDLEFEVEAVPAISTESSVEAVACVKVLISSVSQRGTCPTSRSTVEAPLTINIPNGQLVPADKRHMVRSSSGVNITVPVSVQKHLTPPYDLDKNLSTGPGSQSKKKKKLWTDEEEHELANAVQKFGEGNWTAISKGTFPHNLQNRTASQMSQRWSVIRKRKASLQPSKSNSTREELLAAQKALSLAIDMPMNRNFSSSYSGFCNTPSSTPASSSTICTPVSEVQRVSEAQRISAQPAKKSHHALYPGASRKGASDTLNKTRPAPRKQNGPFMSLASAFMPSRAPPVVSLTAASAVPPSAPPLVPPVTSPLVRIATSAVRPASPAVPAAPQVSPVAPSLASPAPPAASSAPSAAPPASPAVPQSPAFMPTSAGVPSTPVMTSACLNSTIQAAALAAGGRIATPSTAASFLKVASSKAVVHIMPFGSGPTGGISLPGSNIAPGKNQGAKARRTQLIKSPSMNSSPMPLKPGSHKARGFGGKPGSFAATSSLPTSNKSTMLETKSGTPVSATQEISGLKTGGICSSMNSDKAADNTELDRSRIQDHQNGLRSMDVDIVVERNATISGKANNLKSASNENHTRGSKV